MADSIMYIIRFLFFFALYMIIIPAKVMKLKLTGKECGVNMMKALVASYLVLINVVYVLSFLHIYKPWTLALSVVLVILVYLKIKGVKYKNIIVNVSQWFALVSGGQYKFSIFFKRFWKNRWNGLKAALKEVILATIKNNLISNLVIAVSIVILIMRRWELVWNNYAYLTSDMYVHQEWINYLENDCIFYDGVYPFGFHNVISAFHYLSGLNLNIVMRFWGPTNSILLVFVLICFLRKIFRSNGSVAVAVAIYCVSDFAGNSYVYRMAFSIPQEIGMIFMIPCIYFLGKYLEEQRREDCRYFVLCAALMLAIHFYTVIFGMILCFGVCVVYGKKIINWKTLKKLAICVVFILLIAVTPFVIGLAGGRYWQGSMTWAMGVMNSSTTTESTEAESNISQLDDEEADQEEVEPEGEAEQKVSIFQKAGDITYQVAQKFVEDMYSFWGYVYIGSLVLFTVYIAYLFLSKKITWKDKMYVGIWISLLLCTVLFTSWAFGLPRIMKEERLRMLIGYIAPILMVFPLELLVRILPKRIKFMAGYVSYVTVGCIFFWVYALGNKPFQSYFYLEPSLAAKACVKIQEEFPDNTWTVVSPVEELSLVRGHGFHYELWEFIAGMEHYSSDMVLEIPTENVFFIVEKQPLQYNQFRVNTQEYENPNFLKSDARLVTTKETLNISETGNMKFYNIYETRKALEAKLYYWMREYAAYFPDQVEVYMEDDECIVYRFKQNMYALNNFAIPYTFNEISDEEYDKLVEEAQQKAMENESGE